MWYSTGVSWRAGVSLPVVGSGGAEGLAVLWWNAFSNSPYPIVPSIIPTMGGCVNPTSLDCGAESDKLAAWYPYRDLKKYVQGVEGLVVVGRRVRARRAVGSLRSALVMGGREESRMGTGMRVVKWGRVWKRLWGRVGERRGRRVAVLVVMKAKGQSVFL